LVVKGLDPHDRENYLLWEEGRPPQVVIEVTSESTREEDLYDKFEICRDQVQVAEYFLFDPRGEYLQPALQGYRLRAGRYGHIKPVAGRLPSRELGLHLQEHERHLRFFDPATGNWIPTLQESAKRRWPNRNKPQSNGSRPKPNGSRPKRHVAKWKRNGKWQKQKPSTCVESWSGCAGNQPGSGRAARMTSRFLGTLPGKFADSCS
jgi:hypothetical protein